MTAEHIDPHRAPRMGDVVRLRRKHPCGADLWTVTRVGADIGLHCAGCGHRVLLSRDTYRRRIAAIVTPGPALDPAIERALFGEPPPDSDSSALH